MRMSQRFPKEVGLPAEVIGVIEFHHERWDGNGYPDGLRGEAIPLMARVCSVADAFDSMMSDRPYRKRRTVWEALEELKRHSGTQFDGTIVEKFVSLSHELCRLYGDRPDRK